MRVLQKQEASAQVLEAMTALKEGGVLQKWGAALAEPFDRRNVFMGDLKRVGVLNPQAIGVASIREALSDALNLLEVLVHASSVNHAAVACRRRQGFPLRCGGQHKVGRLAVMHDADHSSLCGVPMML